MKPIVEIDVPIFFGRVIVWVTDDFAPILKDNGIRDYYADREGLSFTVEVNETEHHILLRLNSDSSILIHELVHTTNNILQQCNIKADYDNDETQAYLMSWLYKTIVEKIGGDK